MLAFVFFISVFSTIVWLIYSLVYVSESLGGVALFSLGMANILSYVSLILLPILVLWMIFGYVVQFISTRNFNRNLYSLFRQMKKNQDYSDLLARIMLETEKDVKDGFILGRFDLFVSDMNELLSDILSRSNIASPDQIERLWAKVQNGGKWAFGKVVIEVNNNQPNFQLRLFEKTQIDHVLAGTLMEFCSRYLSLVGLLEKHDRERAFLNIIETGVFGKVFSIFAPISDEINRFREPEKRSERRVATVEEEIESRRKEREKKILKPKASIFKKKEKEKEETIRQVPALEEEKPEEDAFSMALRRSFGSESDDLEEETIGEEDEQSPKFESAIEEELFINNEILERDTEEVIPESDHSNIIEEVNNTQKALESLKKEWDGISKSRQEANTKKEELVALKETEEENFAYPFAGWTDEENYKK